MKIAIDTRRLLHEEDHTWPYYISSLVSALQKIDKANEYTLLFNFFRKKYAGILAKHSFPSNIHKKVLRVPHRIFEYIYEDLHIPIDTVLGKTDVIHGPVYACFRNYYGKSVTTIHDLIFLRIPEQVSPGWVKFAKKNTDYAIKKADAIISISEFIKNEIIDTYKIPGDRIRVIYNGISKEYFKRTDGIDEVKKSCGITGRYILYVGAIEPRKNVLTLVQAYHKLPQNIRSEYKLVLVGVSRYGSEEVFSEIEKLDLNNDVIFTGIASLEVLPYLYSGAAVFVFPSLDEGFGMPPLEAMACGTPVIASNFSAIPEITGNAALLINSLNHEEITGAIETVLADHDVRDGLIRQGLERARLFSWERTARETLALYKEVA